MPYSCRKVHLLVFLSCIEYCNTLHTGVSKCTLNKLQYVQNSAARILTRTNNRYNNNNTTKNNNNNNNNS